MAGGGGGEREGKVGGGANGDVGFCVSRVRASVLLVSKFGPVRLEDLDADPCEISEFW